MTICKMLSPSEIYKISLHSPKKKRLLAYKVQKIAPKNKNAKTTYLKTKCQANTNSDLNLESFLARVQNFCDSPIVTDVVTKTNMAVITVPSVKTLQKFALRTKSDHMKMVRTRTFTLQVDTNLKLDFEFSAYLNGFKNFEGKSVSLSLCDKSSASIPGKIQTSLNKSNENVNNHQDGVNENCPELSSINNEISSTNLIVTFFLKQSSSNNNNNGPFKKSFKLASGEKEKKGILDFIGLESFQDFITDEDSVTFGVMVQKFGEPKNGD